MSDKDEQQQAGAQKHYDIEPGIRHIFKLREESAPRESWRPPPSSCSRSMPILRHQGSFRFSLARYQAVASHYHSVIVEVTPEPNPEDPRRWSCSLPHGWMIAEQYPRENP